MSILDKANKAVNGDRQSDYGDPVENAVREAIIATITTGKALTPKDIVLAFMAKKQVRASKQNAKEDTHVDVAGYSEILARVERAMADGTVQKIVEKLLGGWVKFEKNPYGGEILVGAYEDTEWLGYPDGGHIRSKITINGPRLVSSFGPLRGERVALVKLK